MLTLKTADQISVSKTLTLAEGFQERVRAWYQECIDQSLLVYIYCGYRSNKEQAELYKQGRETPGRKVTNAKAGQSFHNYGRAIDWVPLKPHDKSFEFFEAAWESKYMYEQGQLIAAKYNLRWLSWEMPHLEDGNYKDWRELSALSKESTLECSSESDKESDHRSTPKHSESDKKSSRPATGWRSR